VLPCEQQARQQPGSAAGTHSTPQHTPVTPAGGMHAEVATRTCTREAATSSVEDQDGAGQHSCGNAPPLGFGATEVPLAFGPPLSPLCLAKPTVAAGGLGAAGMIAHHHQRHHL
jgi:hypothetical protein